MVWQLGREDAKANRDFLPRLGGAIARVALIEGDRCLVATVDCAVHCARVGVGALAKLWTVAALTTSPAVGFFVGPHDRLAANGVPGRLQILDAAGDVVKDEVDVTPHNRTMVKRRPGDDPVLSPVVIACAFSKDGTHLATVDEWRPRETPSPELKFWTKTLGTWACSAVVRKPHGAGVAVRDAAFHPRLVCVCTAGDDGLRVWGLAEPLEDGGAPAGSGGWICISRSEEQPDCGPACFIAFANDGSAIAAAHAGVTTVWDPASGELLSKRGEPDESKTPLAVGFVDDKDGYPRPSGNPSSRGNPIRTPRNSHVTAAAPPRPAASP